MSYLFPLHENYDLAAMHIGQEQQPLVVINRFLKDADALKRYAIEKSAFKKADNFYPGVRMVTPANYAKSLTYHLVDILEAHFGITRSDIRSVTSAYSIVTRRESELQLLQKIPHFDVPLKNGIAMIHYLCGDPFGGTSFYRHRETGFEFVDKERVDRYFLHVKSRFNAKSAEPDGYIKGSTDEYERIAQQTAEYNKLLIYRGSSLHSGDIDNGYSFEPSPGTGRLTITSFILAE